nr:putative ribonuclease h protein [Quercus suber]
MDYLEEFHVANHKIQVKEPQIDVGWTGPHPPCLKINMDGAVFARQGSVGIGVVVRDHLGVARAALCMKVPGLLGPLETEAKAMEVTLRFASEQGVSAAIFEGDSTVAFNRLTGSINPPSCICNLISGSLLLASRFGEYKFSVVPRCGNRVADGLAHFAKNLSGSCTWLGDMVIN